MLNCYYFSFVPSICNKYLNKWWQNQDENDNFFFFLLILSYFSTKTIVIQQIIAFYENVKRSAWRFNPNIIHNFCCRQTIKTLRFLIFTSFNRLSSKDHLKDDMKSWKCPFDIRTQVHMNVNMQNKPFFFFRAILFDIMRLLEIQNTNIQLE